MPPLLIVNADDFGLEEEINDAIIHAHKNGIVTSTSLLANGAAFEHAVGLSKAHPGLGVGAHLALTRGPSLRGGPVSGAELRSLGGARALFPKSPVLLAARVSLGAVDLHEVEKEFRAQLRKIKSAGISPTHIDTHQHIHLLPPIFRLVLALAREFKVKWIRMPIPLPNGRREPQGTLKGRAKQKLLEQLAKWNMKQAADSEIRWADYQAGIQCAGKLSEGDLLRIVRHAPEAIVEISCHPGSDNESLNRNHPWNYDWQQELQALCSEKVRTAIEELHVHLRHYGTLAASGASAGRKEAREKR